MKKTTKGIAALSAGLLLALGSAGSLAYWQTQTSTGAATFTTGSIDLEAEASDWQLNGNLVTDSTETSSIQLAKVQALRLVPGDSLVWNHDYSIAQQGTDLYLELDVAIGGLTANAANPSAPVGSMLTASYTIAPASGSAVTLTRVGSTNTYEVEGSGRFTVVVTLAWPFGTTADSTGATEGQKIDFANTQLTLRQVAAPIPV